MIDMGNNRNVANIITCFQSFFFLSNGMLKKCLQELGINISSLVYSGLSTARAALTGTEKELGVALVDIGGSNTTITIFSESSPCYSTVVPIGANNVTNDLLYKAGLDLLVVPSAELSRGRGGPRCMSMPFVREDL